MASKQVRQLKLQIPAAAGNLGPALDTVGLALGLYCRLTFELLPQPDPTIPMVQYSGPGVRQSTPKAVDSLTYKLLNELWRDNRNLVDRVRIKVDSDIPLGSGLGGRTSAILGALWADNIFNDRVPITSELLARMADLEGHTETFAASLIGGFVVSSRNAGQKKVTTLQHEWPHDWSTVIALPDRRLTTNEARAVLPKTAPIFETIFNLQRTALLVSAVVSRDENAMREALEDKIHEPYRAEIIPEFPEIKKALAKKPIIGCVLAGGGPSVLVIFNRRHRATVLQTLDNWAAANSGASVLELEVDRQGIREMI